MGAQTQRNGEDLKCGALTSATEMIRDGLDANETLFLKTHGVYENVPTRRGKGAS